MSHRSKWLLLFTLFLLAGSLLAACVSPQDGNQFLQSTLAVLQTKAANLEATAVPQPPPADAVPPVPMTGKEEPQVPVPAKPLPAQEFTVPSNLPGQDGSQGSDALTPQPASAPDCPTHEATVTLSAPKTTLKVGEAIEVKVALENTGCVTLGLPQYRLAILNSEGKAIFSPDKPDPVIHSIGVTPGRSDEVSFLLQADSPGKATLSALASFEVHLGYPGPAYWGAASSKELVIVVEPVVQP